MIQLYPLSLLLLAVAALFSFLEVFRTELSFFLRFKIWLRKNDRARMILCIITMLTAFLMLLFPLYPGPMILGDLFPSLSLFLFFLEVRKLDSSSVEPFVIVTTDLSSNPYFKKGVLFSIAFLLHFLFPSFIIL